MKRRRLGAVLGDIDALSPRLWLKALRQDLLNARLVAWLSDGGRGFWRLYRERFASLATGILDFYHAAQNLWKGAAAWLDGRTTRARTWFIAARHQLRHGQAEIDWINGRFDDLFQLETPPTFNYALGETKVIYAASASGCSAI